MKTYLVTWNPANWPWEDYDDDVGRVRRGKPVIRNWTCQTKKVEVRDRIFLLRQGSGGRGVVGAGHATGVPERDDNGTLRVKVRFGELLPLAQRLDRSELSRGQLAAGEAEWNTRFSGRVLPDAVAEALEARWRSQVANAIAAPNPDRKALGKPPGQGPLATDAGLDDEVGALEGEARARLVFHRSREWELRERKIREAHQRHGGRIVCEVPGCGFDFQARYGELGMSFAEVHHLKPLSARDAASETRLDELAVVCSNCHRMIHRGGECRDLGGLIPPALRLPAAVRARASL